MDTVEVGPGQRVDILLDANNPGVWPFHCHRLNHIANDNIYPGGMLFIMRYID
jgi:FtsP/CotA-like multicopper oxidase with cupredoxin domain